MSIINNRDLSKLKKKKALYQRVSIFFSAQRIVCVCTVEYKYVDNPNGYDREKSRVDICCSG